MWIIYAIAVPLASDDKDTAESLVPPSRSAEVRALS
jgi:hypothetical protein